MLHVAGEVLDVSACFPLSISALSRLLLRRRGCQVVAPHLGHVAGLAVRMLDPSSPALRSACLQPVSTLVRDLLAKFPQVAYSSSTMQLAVGAFSLGRAKLAAEGHTAADSGMSSRQQDDHQLYEAAVAVFDMNGGKRRVLLLPLANAAPLPAEADVPVRVQPTQQLRHNSTMARAEAAMLDHWFGGASGDDATSTTGNKGAASVQADTASAPVYPAPSSAALPVISAQDCGCFYCQCPHDCGVEAGCELDTEAGPHGRRHCHAAAALLPATATHLAAGQHAGAKWRQPAKYQLHLDAAVAQRQSCGPACCRPLLCECGGTASGCRQLADNGGRLPTPSAATLRAHSNGWRGACGAKSRLVLFCSCTITL